MRRLGPDCDRPAIVLGEQLSPRPDCAQRALVGGEPRGAHRGYTHHRAREGGKGPGPLSTTNRKGTNNKTSDKLGSEFAMTCRPWRWLWGLIPLALIALLIILGERPRIERALEDNAKRVLLTNGLKWARAEFEGRDAALRGRAPSSEERRRAAQLLAAAPGVRIVFDDAELIPKVSQFYWSASRDQNRIKLKGYVPRDSEREAILGIVRASFPGMKVLDRMALARGGPPKDLLLSGASFALNQLHLLAEGRVTLIGRRLEIHGLARDSEAYTRIKAALANDLPPGIRLARSELLPPVVSPFTLSATFRDGRLLLEGNIMSEEAQERVVAKVKKHFGEIVLEQDLAIARGHPLHYEQLLHLALEQLARLRSGKLTMAERHITFTGTAETQDLAEEIAKVLESQLPPKFELEHKIAFIKARPPTVSPFFWAARRQGERLVLTGHYPDEKTRALVVALAKDVFPDLALEDRMSEARGAPKLERWREAVQFALRRLAELREGEVALHDLELSLEGSASSPASYRRLKRTLQAKLPPGVVLAAKDIAPARVSPYRWSAEIAEGKLLLSGYAPDEDIKAALLREARALLPSHEIADALEIARGVPVSLEAWRASVHAALSALASLGNGRAELIDRELAITAQTSSEAVREKVLAALEAGVAQGYRLESRVRYVPPPEPNLSWRAVLADGRVRLEGEVPSAAVRRMLHTLARRAFAAHTILDKMKVRAGYAENWQRAAATGLKLLKRLRNGSVSLVGRTLKIEGKAAEAGDLEVIRETLLARLPRQYRGQDEVSVASVALEDELAATREIETLVDQWARERIPNRNPYTWQARFDGKAVVLTGSVPSERMRARMLAAAERAFPARKIVDRTRLARGEPAGYLAAVSHALSALAELREGQAVLEGETLRLEGMAESKARADRLERRFAEAPRLNVSDGAAFRTIVRLSFPKPKRDALPRAKPYEWAAALSGQTVLLTGVVPSEQTRSLLRALVRERFPGKAVVDQLRLANGAPAGFERAAREALRQLAQLESGEVTLVDAKLDLAGLAGNEITRERIQGALAARLPRHYRVRTNVEVTRAQVQPTTPPRSQSTASSTPQSAPQLMPQSKGQEEPARKANKETEGTEASEVAKAAVAPSAGKLSDSKPSGHKPDTGKRNAGTANTGNLSASQPRDAKPSAGNPGHIPRYTEKKPRAESPKTASTGAWPLSLGAYGDETTAVSAAPGVSAPETFRGNEGATRMVPPPARKDGKGGGSLQTARAAGSGASGTPVSTSTCDRLIDFVVRSGVIEFANDSAKLTAASKPTLNRLVRLAKRCPQTVIQINGHTDSVGNARYNYRLSLRRAEAVAHYLHKRGIPRSRLITRGFGETRPIAPNTTPENKARNRRIEMAVLHLRYSARSQSNATE